MAFFKLFNYSQQLVELSMRLRGARHEILSANVANAETPGYRPRDLDFESIMRGAVQMDDDAAGTREEKMERLLRAPMEMQGAIYEPVGADHKHGEDRLDGNSVALDRQLAMVNENALAYEASLTLFSKTMANLRYAIGEGRR